MKARESAHLVEAFLVLDQPRQRLGHWCAVLAPLDGADTPPLVGVSAYFDPSTDQVLLGLRYDPASLGERRLGFLIELAVLIEIGMIQPAELADGDRRRFLSERLTRCSLHVGERTEVIDALIEIVRRIREHKATTARATMTLGALPLRPPEPLGAPDDPVLLVAPKGTRDEVRPPPSPASRAAFASGARRFPRDIHGGDTREISPVEAYRQATARLAPAALVEAGAAPHAAPAARPTPPPAGLRARAGAPATPASRPATPSPGPLAGLPGVIHARYLRSGRWVPTRVGALSLKGAALMSGALPRPGDHVDVALAFGPHRALVRGSVGKVSSPQETATTGTATFSVAFELEPGARRQLTALLTAARAANVTIKPPPPRAARRYPVAWPLCLGTPRGALRAEAIDISREGMFVRSTQPLVLGTEVQFSTVLDDDEPPIAGTARVIRCVSEADAGPGGLTPGFGLQLVGISEATRTRWLAFLARIEQRAGRRVLIGAGPARLAELQEALTAAGYAVTGATDPGALVALAGAEVRPADAALLDAPWLPPAASGTCVETVLTGHGIPCAMLSGDARSARAVVDALLAIG